MRKPNPWINKLRECAKEYQIEKRQSKLKLKKKSITKGQKILKNAVNRIERKALEKKKIDKGFQMMRRIKGNRY